MAIFLLIRHAQNNFVGKKLAGRLPDVHLNQTGTDQAQQLAARLEHLPIKAVISSPLERAQETAAPIASLHNLPVGVMPEFLEIDYGEWQGKSFKQLNRKKLWQQVQQQPSKVRFPGGESFIEAQSRISQALIALSGKYDEKDLIACVSHCDLIRLAVAHFLGMPLDRFQSLQIDPASVTVLRIHQSQVSFGPINYTSTFPEIS